VKRRRLELPRHN